MPNVFYCLDFLECIQSFWLSRQSSIVDCLSRCPDFGTNVQTVSIDFGWHSKDIEFAISEFLGCGILVFLEFLQPISCNPDFLGGFENDSKNI